MERNSSTFFNSFVSYMFLSLFLSHVLFPYFFIIIQTTKKVRARSSKIPNSFFETKLKNKNLATDLVKRIIKVYVFQGMIERGPASFIHYIFEVTPIFFQWRGWNNRRSVDQTFHSPWSHTWHHNAFCPCHCCFTSILVLLYMHVSYHHITHT